MRRYKIMLNYVWGSIALSLLSSIALAHNGHGDELPWQACSEAKKNDSCEYTNSHKKLFRGNCKAFNKALMCVRNQPIIHIKDAIVDTNVTDRLMTAKSLN